jgi:hypothetical protein
VGTELPEHVELVVSPGADGRFDLVEDDGAVDARAATTTISWDDAARRLSVDAATGAVDILPPVRSWSLLVLGADAAVYGTTTHATPAGSRLDLGTHPTTADLTVALARVEPFGWDRTVERVRDLLDQSRMDHNLKSTAYDVVATADGPTEAAARLRGLELDPAVEAALLELVLATWR